MDAFLRILVIANNPYDELLLLRYFEKAGIEENVNVINDGGTALNYLTNGHFECEKLAAVFLELDLPAVNGLTILKAIRSDYRLQSLNVIIMTSSHSQEELQQCEELGVSCVIQKPMTFSSFARALAHSFIRQRSDSMRKEVSLAHVNLHA